MDILNRIQYLMRTSNQNKISWNYDLQRRNTELRDELRYLVLPTDIDTYRNKERERILKQYKEPINIYFDNMSKSRLLE